MQRIGKRAEQGFSLVELLIIIAMVMIVASMAVMSTRSSTYASKANDAMFEVITQLRTAREIAVTKRRNVLVTFTAPNEISLTVETLAGEAPAAVIAPVYLNDGVPGGCTFMVYSGVPDTPMGFGNATAINFAPATGGTAGLAVMFSTSGELVGSTGASGYNTVGNNNPVNASIFTAIAGQPNSVRAVTVMGTTGRVRSYSWTAGATGGTVANWQEEQ
ncbi:MAG TPA: prepilin-type N-terminal cleavage/methylation domain-containing protein [Candidatus Acidoferrum sp.]|nr:prepilin-type N-terminal cleavage/methylation domain-containing protein [Candidatus Acidoferrum sp.]